MKKYLAYILFIVAAMAVTGCSGGASEATTAVEAEVEILPGGGTANVYVITKEKGETISKAELYGAGAVIEEAGYVVKAAYHDGDASKQAALVAEAIEQKAEAIVLDPASTDGLSGLVQDAKAAGIPVFLMEKDETQVEEAAGTTVMNFVSAGKDTAAALVEKTGSSGVYVELLGTEGDQGSTLIEQGFSQGLDGTGISVAAAEWIGNDKAAAQEAVTTLLSENDQITGILCANEETALGAEKAVRKAEASDRVFVACVGSSDDVQTAVDKDRITAACALPASEAGTEAGKQVVAYLTEQKASTEAVILENTFLSKSENE
ncbi:MAG: substrate-binding domain-containing protein [Lachnospiraceae bacterium]|nr:substrate-binding domain-containing protein [Lachnospiraceae bacterium]